MAPYVPEIVTAVEFVTELVITVNVAEVAFAGTVMLAGTWATFVLLLDKLTTAPAGGAGPVKVTVPVEELPPVTLEGFNDTDANVTDDDAEEKLTPATFPLLTVVLWLAGVNTNPALFGVTVYVPLASPVKL